MNVRSRLMVLALTVALPLRAQTSAPATAGATRPSDAPAEPATAMAPVAPRAAGPTARDARAGVQVAAPEVTPSPAPRPADTSHNRAMMWVGGAALIVGAVVGGTPGTVIMVGGALVGLYGLYKFLE